MLGGIRKAVLWLFLAMALAVGVYAECGSNPTDGCLVTENTTFNFGTYYLPSGIIMWEPDVYLDCNGATLIGSGYGGGVSVDADYVTIKNCNIENYSYGIYLNAWEDINGCWGHYVSKNALVEENTLIDNEYGIYIKGTGCDPGNYHVIANNNINNNSISGIYLDYGGGNNISGNSFSGNANYAIHTDCPSFYNNIWDNNIYDTGIRYDCTSSNNYCVNGIENRYYNGVKGPSCSCLPLQDTLIINNNVTVCKDVYNLTYGISIVTSDTYLDCNGATLIGSGDFGTIGVSTFGDYVEIKNCNIENYDSGISLVSKNSLVKDNNLTDNGYGIYMHGTGSIVTNNNINDNLISGVYLDIASENNISGNSFSGNANYAIHTDCSSFYNNIWDNDVYNSGIKYDCVNSNNYCVNGVENRYHNGAEGPTCSCFPLYDNLMINNNITVCKDVYNLPNGIMMVWESGLYLDCNGATLIGLGYGGGIYVYAYDATIRNCNVGNYSYGIYLLSGNSLVKYNTLTDNSYGVYMQGGSGNVVTNNNMNNNSLFGVYLYSTSGNNISGNYLYSNYMGVYLDSLSQNNLFWNNDILSDNYSIYNNQADNVLAENNWWGSADEGYIKSKIYDCLDDFSKGCVDYSPWLTVGPEDRILDLGVDSSDISFEDLGDEVKTSALISNKGNYDANNVEVEFLDTYNDMLIKKSTINIGIVGALNSKKASVNWELEQNHIVYVIIDPDNKIRESDKGNNNAHKEYTGTLRYYVEADVPPSAASYEIETYIKDNIKNGVIVDNKEEADIKVLVARHNPTVVWHFSLREEEGCGFYGGTIKFQDETCDKPYCGVVCDIVKGGKKDIYIEANDVDGFIAASKAFVEKQDSFKSTENGIFLDERNEDAIAVYDYLHTPINLPYYKEDSDEFGEIVRRALKGEMYEEEQINTTANDVTLRLLHLKPGFSTMFIDYKDEVKLPVVLARGLWSDLYTWEGFGKELSSNEGRDTWLIEITGGPGQDCDSCPNYSFDDLTDYYVPALLNKVLSETGKSELQYVGFSNGCRATLSSLEKGSFESNKVNTFVGVGCPGAFNGTSLFGDCLLKYGDNIKQYFESEGITHISQTEFSQRLAEESPVWSSCYLLSQLLGEGDGEISRSLSDQYLEWIKISDDPQPGAGLNFDRFSLIYGYNGFGFNNDNDYIVPENDEAEIYNGIIASYKHLYGLSYRHNQLPNNKAVKKIIKEEVNKI